MRRFRIDDTRLTELCAKNLSVPQIAARMGVSENTVRYAVKRLNLSVAAAPTGKTGIYFASRA
jgi:hypothetical protein